MGDPERIGYTGVVRCGDLLRGDGLGQICDRAIDRSVDRTKGRHERRDARWHPFFCDRSVYIDL